MCNCVFYVREKQFCVTGSEDGRVGVYAVDGGATSIPCEEKDIVLCVDCLDRGVIAAGSMGSKNLVSIFSCESPVSFHKHVTESHSSNPPRSEQSPPPSPTPTHA